MSYDEEINAVDVPLGCFFALPNWNVCDINSVPIQVSRTKNHPFKEFFENPPYSGGLNCYWEMPFLQKCEIVLTNYSDVDIRWFYHIDREEHECFNEAILYFHATHKEEYMSADDSFPPEDYNITDNSVVHEKDKGNYVACEFYGYTGHYMGLSLMVKADPDCSGRWWEGDEMIVLDGEQWPPSIHGTGLEDYCGLAYCF